jgi:hypothetical protein
MTFDTELAKKSKKAAEEYLKYRIRIESGDVDDDLWDTLQKLDDLLQPTYDQRIATSPLLDGDREQVRDLCQNHSTLALIFFGALRAYQQLHPSPKDLRFDKIIYVAKKAEKAYEGKFSPEFPGPLSTFGYLIGVQELLAEFNTTS